MLNRLTVHSTALQPAWRELLQSLFRSNTRLCVTSLQPLGDEAAEKDYLLNTLLPTIGNALTQGAADSRYYTVEQPPPLLYSLLNPEHWPETPEGVRFVCTVCPDISVSLQIFGPSITAATDPSTFEDLRFYGRGNHRLAFARCVRINYKCGGSLQVYTELHRYSIDHGAVFWVDDEFDNDIWLDAHDESELVYASEGLQGYENEAWVTFKLMH